MDAFATMEGVVMPLDRSNVDTDQIIPARFLKKVARTGFGPDLFLDIRTAPDGSLDPSFVLNQPRYAGASILLARDNFGCGSSREHAVWALVQAGFRCVIAPSFADIFYNNYLSNGAVAVVLPTDVVDMLFRDAAATEGYSLSIDLLTQTVTTPSGAVHHFAIDSFKKDCLVRGLDSVGWTLQFSHTIDAFEQTRARTAAWLTVGL